MSLYLGENCISAGGSSAFKNNNIGEIIQSTIPITDAGLHLLDGSVISGSGSYSAFVDYIAGLVSSNPDIFETETNWQTSVTNYGVCGKFVYDSVNNTVRLPKITGFTEGTIDPTVLGDLTEAGLPNITGDANYATSNTYPPSGAFYKGTSRTTLSNNSSTTKEPLLFDASLSSSVYGNSSTVQPQSIKVLYYIVIATSTKTEIEVDIDEITTDLNGKADVDLTNVNASGTSLASGWSMPSSRYIDLTLGADNSTYAAPANGFLLLNKASSASGQRVLIQNSSTGSLGVSSYSTGSGQFLVAFSLGQKGDEFTIRYTAGGTTASFRFIYAEGENV